MSTPQVNYLETTLAGPVFLRSTHWRNHSVDFIDTLFRRTACELIYTCLIPIALVEALARFILLAPAYLLYLAADQTNETFAERYIFKPVLNGIFINTFVSACSLFYIGQNPIFQRLNPNDIRRQIFF
ncbi:MAG: hypothetical protein SP1CHLAM54_07190 [Chlamydiia bacterium]|nr:hypothetical protein [Chlamydiia bacterium]MCH9615625.1 hypothetical protein [Chlamydiia bacterium]MCH9628972.1 hypothetical protein [Chlamydiia bacterium]